MIKRLFLVLVLLFNINTFAQEEENSYDVDYGQTDYSEESSYDEAEEDYDYNEDDSDSYSKGGGNSGCTPASDIDCWCASHPGHQLCGDAAPIDKSIFKYISLILIVIVVFKVFKR